MMFALWQETPPAKAECKWLVAGGCDPSVLAPSW